MRGKTALGVGFVVLVVAVAAAALLFSSPEEAEVLRASTITVGLSTFDVIETDPSILEGLGLEIEVLRFQIPPQSIDAIIRGDTQLTVLPVELAGLTMLRGGDVYIVALDYMMNQAIIALPGSGVESPEDLKGRRVAAVVGSGTYAMFKSFMKELYGITVSEEGESDVIVVNVRPGDVLNALLKGDADAAVIWDPIVSIAVEKHGAVIVASYQELWEEWSGRESAPMLVWIARAEVVSDGELLDKVLEAHRRAAEKWNEDRSFVVDMLASLYNLDSDVAELVWERNQMYTGLCISEELKEAMLDVWRLVYSAGYLEEMPPEERIVTCP
ncbi:MAG: ABC transporter substrate-binding protein [Aeropyrum sp.]|nr:ABC transporter substrate-binding protein [Aeropyrum sp.]